MKGIKIFFGLIFVGMGIAGFWTGVLLIGIPVGGMMILRAFDEK